MKKPHDAGRESQGTSSLARPKTDVEKVGKLEGKMVLSPGSKKKMRPSIDQKRD